MKKFPFPPKIAGQLCLDFTNTAEFRGQEGHIDFLKSYEHVLGWCWQAGLIADADTENLQHYADNHPGEADVIFAEAIHLRETIFAIFAGHTENRPENISFFQDAWAGAIQNRSFEETEDVGRWVWLNQNQPACVMWPLVFDAAELFTSPRRKKVRQCPNCGWLFVDTSRNGARRWCSMDYCGSKVKSRRQYERKLKSKSGASKPE